MDRQPDRLVGVAETDAVSKPDAAGTPGASTAGDPYVPLNGNGGYLIKRYDLTLTYKVSNNRLTARAQIVAVAAQKLSRLSLDLAGLRVSKVSVNGRAAARFTQPGRKLHIWPDASLEVGSDILLDVHYAGNPTPVGGRWGKLGWDELDDGVIVASQPNGAPSWFPCNDHPSNKAGYRISVTTDSRYQVLANGVLIGKSTSSSQTTWVYDQPEPMATYLATVQIGRYETVELGSSPVISRAAIPLRRRSDVRTDFARQQQMIEVFSRIFGPYPFAGYTVVVTNDDLEIPLEAQGLSIFGSNFVDGERSHERLVAHELAHQWFGNSVTLDSWQHIWLNEGFACYAEWLWAENSGGPAAAAIAAQARSALAKQPQDLVIADPGPGLMFDDRVYKRGALTLHALRSQMGDAAFFPLIQEWVASKRHGNANTRDFIDLASHRGGELKLLQRWLYEEKLPA